MVRQLPIGLLSALVIKSLVSGAGLPEMIVATALIGLLSLREHLDKKLSNDQIKEHLLAEHKKIADIVSTQNQVIEKMANEIADQKTKLSSVQLATGMQNRLGKIG